MYISQRTAGKAVVRSGPDTGLYVGGTLGGTLGCGIVAAGGRDREGREEAEEGGTCATCDTCMDGWIDGCTCLQIGRMDGLVFCT